MKQLAEFTGSLGAPVLVLHDAASADAVPPADSGRRVHPVAGSLPNRQRWAGVVLVVTDRLALRQAVAQLPPLGRTKAVMCLLTDDEHPIQPAARPDWPPLARLRARRLSSGGALTSLRLRGAVPAHLVLEEFARAAGTSRPTADRILRESAGQRRRFTLPPQIVVGSESAAARPLFDHHVAPVPATVTDPHLRPGPLDDGVLNPIGFHSHPEQGIIELHRGDDAPSSATIEALRTAQAVRVSWSSPTPELARTVAGLAMAGIPVVGGAPPPDAQPWLGRPLCDALSGDPDVGDLLRREEHSVRLRRAALLTHSAAGWQWRVRESAGQPEPRFPACSVVLATRRPQLLDSALRQIARQRGVDLEVVIAGHGFSPDPAQVRDQLGRHAVEVVAVAEDALFGNVLNAGVAAASGEVLVKMDDDDYYGPDFLLDLMLAREYSGADLVGTPAEFVYLSDLDRTIRRHGTSRDASERYANHVAGGTIMISRDALTAAEGFAPVRRFVDHQLFHSLRATGGTIYRAHGLGFMLRRQSDGHTWPVADDHFLDEKRLNEQWDGFVPTRILAPEEGEDR